MRVNRPSLLGIAVIGWSGFWYDLLGGLFFGVIPRSRQADICARYILVTGSRPCSPVLISSIIAVFIGVSAGVAVTRPAGKEFRSVVETIVAMGQTFPPVAVLAIAVPVMGFSEKPAIIALVLYGLLPILQGAITGVESVSRDIREVAAGVGMSARQILWRVELPLAAPVIVAGIRTSVIINIGTAAIASTVGTKTLGSPIIIGLSGFNTAYVIRGAIVVALLAIITDMIFTRWNRRLSRWRELQSLPAAKNH